MKFKFIISKWGNFAFLIKDLVGPFNYNQEIIKQFGKLNTKEGIALTKYNWLIEKIQHLKTNRPFSNFYTTFFEEKDASLFVLEQKIQKSLPKPLYKTWKSIWTIFTPRLDKIWRKHSPLLQYNKRVLKQTYFKNKKQLLSFLKDLSILFGNTKKLKTINIFLMIMPLKRYYQRGFSISTKNIKGDIKIIISCGKLKNTQRRKIIWPLILHEISHRISDSKKYQTLLDNLNYQSPLPFINTKDNLIFQKNIKKNLRIGSPIPAKTKDIIKEIMISSSIRNLYFYQQKRKSLFVLYDEFLINTNQKLAQIPKNKQHQVIYDFNFLKQYMAIKISDLQRTYLMKKKQIDKKFLQEVYDILSNYPKNLLIDLQKIKKAIR